MVEGAVNSLRLSAETTVESQLVEFLTAERLLKPDVNYVIQAGYFERNPDRFSEESLRSGLALKAAVSSRTKAAPKLVTLRNDIGPGCDTSCALPEQSAIDEALPFGDIPIIRQKTALNRGLRRLRKLLKSEPALFTILPSGSESIIAFCDSKRTLIKLAIARGDQLVGLCPLLLASFYEMILREEGPNAVLIDYCHYVEVQKVATAVEVLNGVFLRSDDKRRAIVAAALDADGKNLNPILL